MQARLRSPCPSYLRTNNSYYAGPSSLPLTQLPNKEAFSVLLARLSTTGTTYTGGRGRMTRQYHILLLIAGQSRRRYAQGCCRPNHRPCIWHAMSSGMRFPAPFSEIGVSPCLLSKLSFLHDTFLASVWGQEKFGRRREHDNTSIHGCQNIRELENTMNDSILSDLQLLLRVLRERSRPCAL